MAEWQIEPLDKRAACRKRRRTAACEPQPLDSLPAEWRELLARWVKRGGNSRWETLRNDAGATRVQFADALLDWLLRSGWAAVSEQWRLSAWWPQQVELLNLPQLRAALGLRDKDHDAQQWIAVRAGLAAVLGESLAPALLMLDELPPQRALSRHDLLRSLQRWQDAQQNGTRRDFALFARGDTKALSDAEWNWLESVIDLAEFGIERHTPLLLISAPLTLQLPQGQLDLSACADFAALTPATLASATAASGSVQRWRLIENRTSFERIARQREPDIGAIWLPGFPPGWWQAATSHLLDLAPAPARISCDPDPAGIAIALQAAQVWQQRHLDWQPWKMGAYDLGRLSARKPLTEVDRQQLERLLDGHELHAGLAELARWMLEHGEKGEQEGYL